MTRTYRAALALLGLAGLGACTTAAPETARSGVVVVEARELPACATEYAAVLDLAALARSYGPGAPLFMDALGVQVEQLDQCLAARGAPGATQAARFTIAARQKLMRP